AGRAAHPGTRQRSRMRAATSSTGHASGTNLLECGEAALGVANVRVRLVPRVAGKDRADLAAHVGLRALVKNDFLEAARVPAVDERAKRVHALLQCLAVVRVPVDRLAGEFALEAVDGEARRLERDGDAAGENG